MDAFKAADIDIGYHPDGYRIDKTASAMNRYTQWNISTAGEWDNPEPVCFNSLPEDGWIKGSRRNTLTDLGVAAPGRQGAETQEYGHISRFRNAAGRDASAAKM